MMKVKKIRRILFSDLYRAVISKKFPLAIVIVVTILIGATFEGISMNEDVLYMFSIVMYGMPAMIILIAGVFVYGDSLCLDVEHKYLTNMIVRSGLKEYVLSKVLVIFLTAIICVCLGILCYTSILHISLPWSQSEGNQYEFLMQAGNFRFFLKKKMFFAYFGLCGIQYGLLAGNLAVLSTYISLFITNKMLVLATPFLGYYFIDFVMANLFQERYSLATFFSASNNIMKNDIESFALSLMISVVFIVIVGHLIKRKIKKEYLS